MIGLKKEMMKMKNENNDVIKSIDGVLYYKYDYTDFLYQKLEDFKSRVDKAIKLVESYNLGKYNYTIPPIGIIDLLDILKGDDEK